TMLDLRTEGQIQRIGLSNVTLWQIEQALAVTDVASVSNLYGPTQTDEDPVVDRRTGAGIAFLPFLPLVVRRGGDHDGQAAVARRESLTGYRSWLPVSSASIRPLNAPTSRCTQRCPCRSATPITVATIVPAAATSARPGSATRSTGYGRYRSAAVRMCLAKSA